jgi:CBS domain-containing protein
VTVGVDSSVDEVVETMRAHNVGCVAVIEVESPRL